MSSYQNINYYNACHEIDRVRRLEAQLIEMAKEQAKSHKTANLGEQIANDNAIKYGLSNLFIETEEVLRKTRPIYKLVRD